MIDGKKRTRITALPWEEKITYIALQGSYLSAISEMGNVYVVRLLDNGTTETLLKRSFNQPSHLKLSPSGCYLLVYDARLTRQITLWDVYNDRQKAVYGDAGGRPSTVTATFVTYEEQEILLLAQRRFNLSAQSLTDMRELFAISTGYPYGFSFSRFIPLPHNTDTLFVIGHQEGEGRDTLLRTSFKQLQNNPSSLITQIKHRSHFYDYSYRLFIGPCEGDAVVIFRDPEDAEDPNDYDEGELLHDIECFQGLYIRDLRINRLIERVAYNAPSLPQDSLYTPTLYATAKHIFVELPGRLDIVARNGVAEEAWSYAEQLVSLDSSSGRAALLTDNGELFLVDLQGT